MTMLTHSRDRFEPASRRSGRVVPATTVDLATSRLFLIRAFGLLLMAGAVAGVIALKAAIFVSRLSH